jgi:hypothetical protein
MLHLGQQCCWLAGTRTLQVACWQQSSGAANTTVDRIGVVIHSQKYRNFIFDSPTERC